MATRAEVESCYIVSSGRIMTPGKFELEALYVPYFWDEYLNGGADEDDGTVLTFYVTDEDRAEFPELAERAVVKLLETDSGFVIEVG
ncbi:MAG TPA: hypothetical protein VF748_14595 [Candidatus Acidoferrum sp.]